MRPIGFLLLVLMACAVPSCAIEVTEPQLSWYTRLVAADAPVGWWRLNERTGSTVVDSGTAGVNGTLSASGVSLGGPGALVGDSATSAYFDGTLNQITLGSSVPFDFIQKTQVFSVEAWVKLVDPTLGGVVRVVIGNTASAISGFWLFYYPVNRYFGFGTANGTTSGGGNTGTLPVADVTGWCHVVATGDGTTARVYLNGRYRNSGAFAAASTTGATVPLGIGNTPTAAVPHYGWIQDVAIYNYTMSATQIDRHYQAGARLFRQSEIP